MEARARTIQVGKLLDDLCPLPTRDALLSRRKGLRPNGARILTFSGCAWLSLPNRTRPTERSRYFGPMTEQRYTSVVGVSVISPAFAAARMSLSDVNCCWDMVTK